MGCLMTDLGRLNFLIVDKNKHMQEIVETILRAFGARKIAKTDCAKETLKYILDNTVDIVICDFMYGSMDVLDLTKVVRKQKDLSKRYLAITLLTSDTTPRRIAAARDAGITAVACKPVSAKELFRRLTAIVDFPKDFVESESYVGPDRRRKTVAPYDGVERRVQVNRERVPSSQVTR